MKNKVFKDYKDIHKGKRVFLVANGPSLEYLLNTKKIIIGDQRTIFSLLLMSGQINLGQGVGQIRY